MLPTAIPALLAFGIFSVVAHWNDYFWPRIVITGNRELFTPPPLGLQRIQRRRRRGQFRADDGHRLHHRCTPFIVAFLLAQRRFIEGITLIRNEMRRGEPGSRPASPRNPLKPGIPTRKDLSIAKPTGPPAKGESNEKAHRPQSPP